MDKYNPYISVGTETHLDSSVNNIELFPYNYFIIRKYGNFDNLKGGVLIAMTDDLIGTHRTDLHTKFEIVWITIKIQGSKDVTIGALYRSPQFGDTYDYMNELRESINTIPVDTMRPYVPATYFPDAPVCARHGKIL